MGFLFLIPSALITFKTLTIQRLTLPSQDLPLAVVDYRSEPLVYIMNSLMVLISIMQDAHFNSAVSSFSRQARIALFLTIVAMMLAAFVTVACNLVFWSTKTNRVFVAGLLAAYLWKVVFNAHQLLDG